MKLCLSKDFEAHMLVLLKESAYYGHDTNREGLSASRKRRAVCHDSYSYYFCRAGSFAEIDNVDDRGHHLVAVHDFSHNHPCWFDHILQNKGDDTKD